MENRKGSGIFLGVVSVATLVVAIIGATFAYFSASVSSSDDAVNVEAYEFTVGLDSVTSLVTTKGPVIPFDPAKTTNDSTHTTYMAYAMNVGTPEEDGEGTMRCIADGGFQVCELYEIKFTNTSEEAVELTATVETMLNEAAAGDGRTAFTNLMAQLVTYEDDVYALDTNNAAIELPELTGALNAKPLTATGQTITVPAGGTTIYLAVWLNENDDQSAEMGAKYNGKLIFNSTAGGQLTGTFSVVDVVAG